ncbi:MAG: DEAD/DEAH box helicase family protein [Nitrosopumilus sp.]|nr:DEAD/DEAH box helicase family protein [Nitrosopumilus sp.]
MYKLRNYQEKYIHNLKEKVDEYLNLTSNKICVFKSPTGSGKTIMMAETIKRLVENRVDGKELAFIWITVHKLHDQSKEKLEEYYEYSQSVICSYFEDLQDKQIQDKEILFFNWQSINQEKNIYIREGENENNLSNIIKNTKDEGREIILIIDESHHTASSDKSQEVIQKIYPKITIEVSATPKISNSDYVVSIDLEEVKKEAMIKKSIKLNSKLSNTANSTTDELIIKTALEKRHQLKNIYEQENANVNPLVLIQLPDSRKGMLDKKDQVLKLLDSRFGINTDNGKLAIYLSDKDNKVNLENIEKNTNEVEVLIFKQAITVGWDCPRSSILVLFREWKKFEFSIQTIGRIIRMPEVKHYENDELNHAYVYTNIEEVHIAEDVTKDYITVYESTRRNELNDDIDLKSVYIKRKHEKTRLNTEFHKIFSIIANKHHVIDKISLDIPELKNQIITDAEITHLDMAQNLQGELLSTKLSPMDIQNRFDAFAMEMSESFAPVHSHGVIKRSIYQFFQENTKITDLLDMATITISPNNRDYFVKVINDAKTQFRRDVVEKIEKEIEKIEHWNVPENTEYTKIYKEKGYKKCIMSPAYIKTDIQNEIRFMDLLDDDTNVKWWFKNEVSDKKYFAIKYIDPIDDEPHAFYVDFIIRMNDGRIGLFDPKAGFTAKIAKPKAEALSKYLRNNNSKNLFGGIAIFEKGEWLYNDNEEYGYDENDLSDWKSLDLSKSP